MFTGSLNMNSQDIEDAGTTIYDSSASQIASSVIDYTAATASDVGLGNVRNIDLANTGGTFLSYDTGNEEYNVDGNSIQSGTTASDVGLGNVENEAAVAESGDSMGGNLDMLSNDILFEDSRITAETDDDLVLSVDTLGNDVGKDGIILKNDGAEYGYLRSANTDPEGMEITAPDEIDIDPGENGDSCDFSTLGDINCAGNKNWIHDLNSTHNAVYTSQESPEVRAVYEGKAEVDGEVNITLPKHFSGTVSDSRPSLRAQVTPQGTLTNVAVMEKTDDYIVIVSEKYTKVNYRITGIREGSEDKQVVRPKE